MSDPDLLNLRWSLEAALRQSVALRDDFDQTITRLMRAVAEHVGPETDRPLAPVVQIRPAQFQAEHPLNRPAKLEPDEPCPGCGALPRLGRNGQARHHAADCTRITSRV